MTLAPISPETPSGCAGRVTEVLADVHQIRANRFCVKPYGLGNIRFRANSSLSVSENSGLLKSNFLPGGTQIIHMIEVNTGDNRTIGVKNIDCVQPAAQSHFHDRD